MAQSFLFLYHCFAYFNSVHNELFVKKALFFPLSYIQIFIDEYKKYALKLYSCGISVSDNFSTAIHLFTCATFPIPFAHKVNNFFKTVLIRSKLKQNHCWFISKLTKSKPILECRILLEHIFEWKLSRWHWSSKFQKKNLINNNYQQSL